MDRAEIKPIIEALIFASDIPITIDKIKSFLENAAKRDIEAAIEELKNDYAAQSRGFYLKEVANGFQFRTQSAYAHWVKKLKKSKPLRLTQPTLETLAIIAYKQPITRIEIDKIRGVDSGGIIKTLLDKKFIYIAGRKNIPGKPFLFVTTKIFLEVFGLENLSSLPSIREIGELDNSQLPSLLKDKMSQGIDYNEDIPLYPDDQEVTAEGKWEGEGAAKPLREDHLPHTVSDDGVRSAAHEEDEVNDNHDE